MERKEVGSRAKWEAMAGYSRAVRVGPFVYVAGTTAWDEKGDIVGVEDPHAQTAQILRNIERALQSVGASHKDVVRTRAFVTDIDRWEAIGRAHREFFQGVRPTLTIVQVDRLLEPEMMVEMEADAVIADGAWGQAQGGL